MTDVLPVVLVGTDKHLAVELIGGHGERRHVRRKLKERRKAVHTHKTQTGGERRGRLVFVPAGEYKTPFAERGDVDMVGMRLEASLFQRLGDAPEEIGGEHRRGALHYQASLHAEVPRDGAVEGRGRELDQ